MVGIILLLFPLLCKVPLNWERVSVKPIKLPDGRVTVPEEVIESMKVNKIGLKGRLSNRRTLCITTRPCMCACFIKYVKGKMHY